MSIRPSNETMASSKWQPIKFSTQVLYLLRSPTTTNSSPRWRLPIQRMPDLLTGTTSSRWLPIIILTQGRGLARPQLSLMVLVLSHSKKKSSLESMAYRTTSILDMPASKIRTDHSLRTKKSTKLNTLMNKFSWVHQVSHLGKRLWFNYHSTSKTGLLSSHLSWTIVLLGMILHTLPKYHHPSVLSKTLSLSWSLFQVQTSSALTQPAKT